MAVELAFTRLTGTESSDRLTIVGPSLGTSAVKLWRQCATHLTGEVIAWDLPGHGASPPTTTPFTVRDIADEVEARTTALADNRPVTYAGVSFSGAVGLELASRETRFGTIIAIGAAKRIGTPDNWHERAALVRRAGTPVMVEGSAQRWFAPGFTTREPDTAGGLLRALADTDRESYALACEALAAFEAGEAVRPVHVVVGEHDVVVSPDGADRKLRGCGHLPPAEVPEVVAEMVEEMRCPTRTA
ncbi:3-oxoadipate enol-lactonase/3-oxoadipate enol-lactonase / 4-carboxymuconolactone decarboxylase [Lentzea fradiae]|uniref:3-oxoadipate enol-lactonase/3-oxoadipate enol-lactonase / 4-carboxymuconolactone decarboxylase n=1 Tax=Lentzea fradiae TaxID=200378 RepID=A0A1G7P0Z3_9PSEU|nr:alpha/beta fold hydrolase [Lentzea fradiae]SDF79894.1 3-oxoadipate enol-lactonase/3-oxoadipate enol-lactonase / 4-carboxymuconolactone decarboxylase [Lentzea fradiae]